MASSHPLTRANIALIPPRLDVAAATLGLALVLLSPAPAAASTKTAAPDKQAEPAELTITYLGNEGFLLQVGEKKVLVDALQGAGLPPYVTLPETRRRALERAQPPFDGVQLVLASHYHADHFNARSVIRYLEHNPRARFISTEQAAESLRQQAGDAATLRDRVQGFHPEAGERVRVPLEGIGLTVMNFHHGVGSKAQNLGLLVQLGEFRLLHVGDTSATPAEFVRYGMAGEKIDVVFLPYWLLSEPGWRESVAGSRYVVAMHIPSADAPPDYFGSSASLEGLEKSLRAMEPQLILFEELLQQHSIPAAEAEKPVTSR